MNLPHFNAKIQIQLSVFPHVLKAFPYNLAHIGVFYASFVWSPVTNKGRTGWKQRTLFVNTFRKFLSRMLSINNSFPDSSCPSFEPFLCPHEGKCISIQVVLKVRFNQLHKDSI